MSLKGTSNTSSDGAKILKGKERLDWLVKEGYISTEQYNELIKQYDATLCVEKPQKANWVKRIINLFRG